MDYTIAQSQAINVRDRNILVSAAAGSGKTATLTQRIIALLTDRNTPADISRMLIVTFTKAAAGELRTRICDALTKALAADPTNTHLSRQLTSLGGADICTMDSYYHTIVRENFQRLGLPASFRLDNEGELKVIREKMMNEVIERRFATDPDFSHFADVLSSVRDDTSLTKSLLKTFEKVVSLPDGVKYIQKCAERYEKESQMSFFDSKTGMAACASVCARLRQMIKKSRLALDNIDANPECEPYRAAIEHDLAEAVALLEAVEARKYSAARQLLLDFTKKNLGSIKSENKSEISEMIKNQHGEFVKAHKHLFERDFYMPEEEICKLQLATADFFREMFAVLDDFFTSYTEKKKANSLLEFSDLKSFVMQLFVNPDGSPTDLALAEKEKYSHIFIDEYQDTDRIQDNIFRAISNGHNLFIVGDIKQSIYGFRGAEPSLFAGYRDEYPLFDPETTADGSPCSIFMSENFRCSENVVKFVNAVCSYVFTEVQDNENPGIGYRSGDDLRFGRIGDVSSDPVKIVILEKNSENDQIGNDTESDDGQDQQNAGLDPEAAYVVDEVKRLLREGKNPSGTPIRPDDIAILARSNSDCNLFANALATAGIPVANKDSEGLFENTEVRLMLCLLSAADNPQRDVPLAGVLRSPIFCFTLSDLVNIRLGRGNMSLFDSVVEYSKSADSDAELAEKCRRAILRIESYRNMAEAMPVHRFIRALWKDTGALNYAGADEKNRQCSTVERRRSLQRLYEYARSYEASAFRSLHDFVEYISEVASSGTKIKSEIETSSGCVKVMTVHSSKGLEFPVVFLASTAKNFSHKDASANVLFTTSDDLGLGTILSDPSGFGRIVSPMYSAISDRIITTSNEESMRVLYVALTRARDRLYIVGSGTPKSLSDMMNKAAAGHLIGGRETVIRAKSWLEWILTALDCGHAPKGLGSYVIETPSTRTASAKENSNSDPVLNEETISSLCHELRRRFSFRYRENAAAAIPAKLSVSRLYPDVLTEEDGDDLAATVSLLKKAESMESRVPRFMGGGDNAAERGTATHLFLQFCDFSRLDGTEENAREEAARLTALRFIPRSAADMVRYDEIAAFARSDFFRSLKNAGEVRRETRFNIFLPASEFTTDLALRSKLVNEKLLVQGVIDLFYIDEDGKLVLCDYKTDRLTGAERHDPSLAAQRMTKVHGEQLGYYASALQQILGHRPDRICIFSLHLGDVLDIDI